MIATRHDDTARAVLTPSQRESLRVGLDAQRAETLATITQLDRDVHDVQNSRLDSPTDDEHDPEGTTLAFEQSQSTALGRSARERLGLIDDALERLARGDFGVCRNCGGAIGFARLTARPYAQHCIRCAQTQGAVR